MSSKVQYAFVIAVGAYGIYQMSAGHPVAGGIGIGLAVLLFFLLRRR